MNECSYIEKYLIDYIFGELPKNIEDQITKHLEICNSCNLELQEMLNTINILKSLKDEEAPRILYFKKTHNFFSKIIQFKSLLAIAACIIIILNAFILFKFYSPNLQQNTPIISKPQYSDSLYPEINKMLNATMQKYKNEQIQYLETKMKELEAKLTEKQNYQLVIFKNTLNQDTRSMINDYFKVHEQNRIDDLRNVAETIIQLQQQNEIERAQTYQILNYLVNASDKKTKY